MMYYLLHHISCGISPCPIFCACKYTLDLISRIPCSLFSSVTDSLLTVLGIIISQSLVCGGGGTLSPKRSWLVTLSALGKFLFQEVIVMVDGRIKMQPTK